MNEEIDKLSDATKALRSMVRNVSSKMVQSGNCSRQDSIILGSMLRHLDYMVAVLDPGSCPTCKVKEPTVPR